MIVRADFIDFNKKYAVGADFVLLGNVAMQVCQCAFYLKLAAAAAMPDMIFEAFFG